MAKILFLDTNIYLSILKGDLASAQFDAVKQIITLLNNNEAGLLLPEIIKVEFENNYRVVYKNHIEDLKKRKVQVEKWRIHIEDIKKKKEEIIKDLQSLVHDYESRDVEEIVTPIKEFMSHPKVYFIPTSDEILLSSYKRTLFKKPPSHKGEQLGDNVIIESLLHYFSQSNTEKPYVVFVTNNHRCFSAESNADELHADLKKEFNDHGIEITYSRYLSKVLETEFGIGIPEDIIKNEEEIRKEHEGPSWILVDEELPSICEYCNSPLRDLGYKAIGGLAGWHKNCPNGCTHYVLVDIY